MLRIVINNTDAEYFDASNIQLSLRKRALDLSRPFARLGSNSFTIKLPTTDTNNEIFRQAQHTQTVDKFRKLPIQVYNGSTLLIDGIFNLTSITRDTYEGFIVSNDVGFKEIISGKNIQDLTLGSPRFVGHLKQDEPQGFTLSESWDSATNPYWEYFWFALISYGNFYEPDAFDKLPKITELTFEQFSPNFSLTGIFRKIFEEAGYTVSGAFVDETDLKDLMFTFSGSKVPWNWELLTKIIISNTQVFNTNNIDVGVFGTSPNPLIANKRRYFLQDVTETKDHLSAYENNNVTAGNFPTGQEWFCPRAGTYEFTFNLSTVQTLTSAGDALNALEQAKHNKFVVINADDADTSDENSELFTRTLTPYANTSSPTGDVNYSKINDVTLGVGESTIIKYTNALGGSLDAQYNPATGEYTALTDQTGEFNLRINNADPFLQFTILINGQPANIQPQGYIFNNQGGIDLQSPNTGYFQKIPRPLIAYLGCEATPYQLQAGDVVTFQLTNLGNAPITTLASQFNDFLISVRNLVDRPVPIFETSDLVRAYLEPWKSNSETENEKVGGAPAVGYETVLIDFSNSGYTDNGGGNYTYTTDITYTFRIECDKGELLKIAFLTYNDNSANNVYNISTVNDFTWSIVDGSGEVFNIASALPSISQDAFVSDVIRTFNLFYNIDESRKTISFSKRSEYFNTIGAKELPFSLYDRTFTPSNSPRRLSLGLKDIEDGYKDRFSGSITIEANPYANPDNVFSFRSTIFAEIYGRQYVFESLPRDSQPWEIPTANPNNSTDFFRADSLEFDFNTDPRLVFRGNGSGLYIQSMQGLGIGNVFIDNFPNNFLPISRDSEFNTFEDEGDTIFTRYWKDRFLFTADDNVTITAYIDSETYANLNLRQAVIIENNTYIIQQIQGFNPIGNGKVSITLIRL